ncbi:TPA: HNH endonuclease [Enterococcus faecalis]|nr:HNH endonuclease [Enterococcus faecalis]HAP4899157.1 HNH endonuclease [Enterococcus faecalis]
MMRDLKFEMKDYGVYYFANIIDGVLEDSFSYLRNLNDIFGEGNIQNFLSPFPKISAFHSFVIFIVDSVFREEKDEFEYFKKYGTLSISHWFEQYSDDIELFDKWLLSNNRPVKKVVLEDVEGYLEEIFLSQYYEDVLVKISEEVFFLMFSNRKILQRFNVLVSGYVEMLELSEIDEESLLFLKSSGKVKRVNIPKWVKDAVFFRDRGRCVLCNRDLSNLLSRQNKNNYDHIVPLNLFGLNDVTNIQLLCEKCNMEKLDKNYSTSQFYEKWY